MTDPTPTKGAAPGAPDRVAMLSIAKDGTPDQHDPHFLDEDFAREATRKQFTERAVSVIDETKRPELGLTLGGGSAEETKLDPPIEELRKAHEAAAKDAEGAADALAKSLTERPADKPAAKK
jgi:hypothetical protein